MSAAGLIAGTPTTPGLFTFTPQVTDVTPLTDTTPPVLTIFIIAAPIVVTTTLLNGNVDTAYTENVTSTGGNGAITLAVVAGALTTGLTMNSAGVIAGTSTTIGTSTFTVQATDSVGTTSTQSLSLTILAAVAVVVPSETVCPSTVVAPSVCWFVRPDTDGVTDLNYGVEDGTSYATAFDGMAAITGMAASDTVPA